MIKTEEPTSGEVISFLFDFLNSVSRLFESIFQTSNCLFSLAIKSETEENSRPTASEGASAKSNGPSSTSQYPNVCLYFGARNCIMIFMEFFFLNHNKLMCFSRIYSSPSPNQL